MEKARHRKSPGWQPEATVGGVGAGQGEVAGGIYPPQVGRSAGTAGGQD